MADYQHIEHPLPPLYDEQSRILILGSFPSVKTREAAFFYGHPQNRFWKVMTYLLGQEQELRATQPEHASIVMKQHHIAMWDSIYSCDIIGSSDASIKNIVPTDLLPIVQQSKIKAVFTNGTASFKTYQKLHEASIGIRAVKLPSTSPANAAWSLERLVEAWQVVIETLKRLENE